MTYQPNFMLDPTPENQALAQAVHQRMRSEARLTTAKSLMWGLGGAGALLALAGIGAGAAMWGYARINDVSNASQQLAGAIKAALETTTVRTAGEVVVADGGVVRLDANGAVVGLNPNSTVAIQPGGTVKVDGVIPGQASSQPIPRPTPEQLYGRSGQPPPPSTAVVTNFTVFKEAPFNKGRVTTGWRFANNEQTAPSNQYCYYIETLNGVDVKIDLATDGQPVRGGNKLSLDAAAATRLCNWYEGSFLGAPRPRGQTY